MTPEQQKREKFLRSHGNLPGREVRELLIQRRELEVRIDALKERIKVFADDGTRTGITLKYAWRAELRTKESLLKRVKNNEIVPRTAIKEKVSEIALLKANYSRATSTWREVR